MSPDSEYITSTLEEYFERRAELLRDIDYKIVRKAWFTLSHLLLNESGTIADMGCDDGIMTFCMAALAPNIRFVGIDKSKRQINKAKELYEDKVHNLEFINADISTPFAKEGTYDAVINSYILHEVFSASRYSEKIVKDTLNNHFKMLKDGGTLFIRDFARPPPEEYVLLEMPDISSNADTLSEMSETDLLLWFSEHARPRQDAGCGGFFLEELPPRFPRTRLFRLPYKWAYEFLMRKDDREKWDKQLPLEYTFFTEREFRKELRGLGARVQYSAPYWDEDLIEDRFEGSFRMYNNEGKPLGYPPTSYIAVALKMKERQSLLIGERRPSRTEDSSIRITAMRNENNGEITDVISRDFTPSEILPYHVNDEGRLKVYLHDGIPRGVANTVPRNGENIDGKRWSGHMTEALSVDSKIIAEMTPNDIKDTVKFARDFIGLKPRNNALLVHGPDYYPAPDYIDERIKTYFLDVERSAKPVKPKNMVNKTERFNAKGEVREFDAQQVLNAIAVGLLPNARLELQILSLFEHLNIKPESWTHKDINVQTQKINKRAETKGLLEKIHEKDSRFKEVKGTTGQLRTVHSIFVEEGQSHGSTTGLSSDNMDFVVSDEKTINTAVVIPLTKGLKDDLHAGILVDYLPVPQRHEGNGLTMHAPSFNIPPEITNLKQMKRFIADKFSLKPENVIKLGESYFSHIGLTQHRIYPFAVAAPPQAFGPSKTEFIPFHQYRLLWSSLSKDTHFMVVLARAYQMLSNDIKNDYKMRVKEIVQERFSGKVADWSIPMTYAPPPGKNADAKVKTLEIDKTATALNKEKLEAATKKADLESHNQGNRENMPKQDSKAPAAQPAKHDERIANPTLASKTMKKLTGGHTPFHQKTMEQKKEDETKSLSDNTPPQAQQETVEQATAPKLETDTQLSDDFKEMDEIARVVEKTHPLDLHDPKPEKW
ncbi:MAG: methyltransferase [Micavibrio sp.]|nr:methyltransferase [Micavibrio sp.]